MQSQKWPVRPVTDGDAEGLLALIGTCFSYYAGAGVQLDPDGLDRDLKAYASYIEGLKGEAFVLEAGVLETGVLETGVLETGALMPAAKPTLIASVAYAPVEANLYELKRLYILRDYWGKRLGVYLLDFVEKRILKRGGESLLAWSDSRFERAHAFYRREGFRQTGRTRFLHDISSTTEFEFVKYL